MPCSASGSPPGPDGIHYVDLQVVAQPNSWLKHSFTAADGLRGPAPERADLLQTVHDTIADDLTAQGWRVRLPGNLKYIRLDFPEGHPLAATSYLTFRASSTSFTFRQVMTGAATLQASAAVVERLRDRYGDDFEDAVPEGTAVVWGVGAARKNAVNDQWQAEHPDGGWKTITPDAAAQWAVAVADSWMTLLTDDPPTAIFQAGPPASPPPQIVTTTRVQVVEPSETPSTAGDLPS